MFASAAVGGGNFNFRFNTTPEIKACKIILQKSPVEDIYGKVLITNESAIQHYGLVIELHGTILLPDQKAIKIFPADPNSQFLFKSSVYDHITGDLDAMKRASPSADHKMISNPGESYNFTLKLPNIAPLPKSYFSHSIKIEYIIVVYQRKEFGYVLLEEKAVNFNGYHYVHHPEPTNDEMIYNAVDYESLNGINLQLKTVKACITNEDIYFSVGLKKPTQITVKKVEIKLIRRMIYARSEEDQKNTEVVNSYSRQKNWKQDEFCVHGKLKAKNYMPSYPGEHGFKIDYWVECELTTCDAEGNVLIFNTGLDITIGTAGDPGLNPAMEITSPETRSRSGSRSSIFSFLPPSYSQLSSRAASLMSLLTFQSLPPHYNDVVEKEVVDDVGAVVDVGAVEEEMEKK